MSYICVVCNFFLAVCIAGIGSMGKTTCSITIIDYSCAVIVDFKSVILVYLVNIVFKK